MKLGRSPRAYNGSYHTGLAMPRDRWLGYAATPCEVVAHLVLLPQVETVLIPIVREQGQKPRITLCVSSQVGCAMNCKVWRPTSLAAFGCSNSDSICAFSHFSVRAVVP